MKINHLLYSVMAGAALTMGTTSCNNDEFLTVDHYSILDLNSGYDTDEHALRSLVGCYDKLLPDEDGDNYNADPFKPYIFTGCHPTMDTQATGWDKDFMTQNWTAEVTELKAAWNQSYNGITRCNDFLQNLETYGEGLSDAVRKTAEGEARTIRAFQYFWLATTFGRVPLLETGETYSNTPYKAKAENYEEMWDFIIEDLKAAAELLTWKPYNNQYGRCTKGMALAYLGDAYMWKAYRCPEQATACYQAAETVLKQVLDCGEYELNKSFTTLWDPADVWNKETIFEQVLDEGDNWGSWDSNTVSGANGWTVFYSAAPANGGWGTIALSWELYDAFEPGDKRRDGSLVTASIPTGQLVKDKWTSTIPVPDEFLNNQKNIDNGASERALASPNGYNPFTQDVLACTTYKYDTGGEYAPTVYTTKFWRLSWPVWNNCQWAPAQIYRKRLPNVMLDYAECRFNLYGADDAQAWAQINTLRNRAFGNLEVGNSASLTATFLPYYTEKMYPFFSAIAHEYGEYSLISSYPYPFSEETVSVPDAKTYYTSLKAEKGFTSEVWRVAVNEERRKEFSCEWSLCPDLVKSEYITDHIEHNYPKHSQGSDPTNDWQSVRDFEFDIRKMDMPIPADEITKNPLLEQNDAYK